MREKQPLWIFKRWPQYNDRSTLDIITEMRRVQRITKFNSTAKATVLIIIVFGILVLHIWYFHYSCTISLLTSEHDGTILSLMYAMGVANDQLVPYASSLIMEIYRNGSNFEIEVSHLKYENAEKLAKLMYNKLVVSYEEQQAVRYVTF
ncbi:unnamed protein product [Angiostrongylus costaricensis]|uniref:Piezo_RRas_bdg domain-containing protein n=1 Tax=Angiostrongylus costaricensis TaxID=334426 RepID=A0A0R3PIF3_ANGCS|nr:unnamed protein product [Angiostrongylus costaricensis]